MAEESAQSSPQTLEYAKRPKLAWVGRHRKLFICLSLLIAVSIPLGWFWQPLKHRVLWLYWFQQATQYRMPGKSVDLQIDSNTVPLPASDHVTFTSGSLTTAIFNPHVYRKLLQYDSRLGITGGADQPVAFMGVLKRPDGTPRLVIASGGSGMTSSPLANTSIVVLPLPSWNDPLPPAAFTRLPRGRGGYSGPPPTPSRLRSGVVDPSNPSHIVFEFEAGPQGRTTARPLATSAPATMPTWTVSATGIIDAHLQNDDSISFTVRSFTGDRNVRIAAANARLVGDVQTLQTQSLQQAALRANAATRPTTRTGGRRNGP